MEYLGFCAAKLGTNGTGKTTFGIDLLQNDGNLLRDEFEVKQMGGYYAVLCLVSDQSEESLKDIENISLSNIGNFTGWAKLEVDDYGQNTIENVFNEISRSFYGFRDPNTGLYHPVALFVDDAMAILDTRNEPVMRFFKKRRQHICDIIMNCHGASEYPLSLFKNTTDFILFQTTDSLKSIANRMGGDLVASFQAFAVYVNKVASYGNGFPRGHENRKYSYFRYRFNMKNPPSVEMASEFLNQKWWINGK